MKEHRFGGCGIRIEDWVPREDGAIPDVVATTADRLVVEFDYPLAAPVRFEFEEAGGFTLKRLVALVVETYAAIYAEEAATTKVPEGRAGELLNRNRTNGKYGIWGHDLCDLFLESIEEGADGVWRLGVGS